MGIGQQCDVIASEVDRVVERAIASEFAGFKNPKKARVKAAQSITWFRLWESSGFWI